MIKGFIENEPIALTHVKTNKIGYLLVFNRNYNLGIENLFCKNKFLSFYPLKKHENLLVMFQKNSLAKRTLP